MADPLKPKSDRETPDSDGGSRPRTPRWVKFIGVIAQLLLVLVVVLLVTGGGNHGPGRHSGSGDSGAQTTPSGVSEPAGDGRHKPPPGAHKP